MEKSKRPPKKVVHQAGSRPTTDGPDPLEIPQGEADVSEERTGRSIVTVLDDSRDSMNVALASLKKRAGVSRVCRMNDFNVESFSFEEVDDAGAVVFDELGIAVVGGDTDRIQVMMSMAAEGEANVIVEPEYVNYAYDNLSLDEDILVSDEAEEGGLTEGVSHVSVDFLRGYQQAVNQLVQSLTTGGSATVPIVETEARAAFRDTAHTTWGLQATRVLQSRFSGRGIRVAVLDTGMGLNHPDFTCRTIHAQMLMRVETVQDRNGHGTHCIGTSCGSLRVGIGPRYGIAYEAEIFAGKVLSNSGSGNDGGILGGINWAIRNGCQVVSMSLGRAVSIGERPMRSYEIAGQRALRAGTLIIAAAGNDSSRPSVTRPVSSPANAASPPFDQWD